MTIKITFHPYGIELHIPLFLMDAHANYK